MQTGLSNEMLHLFCLSEKSATALGAIILIW
jgi:hypothetical protein